MKRSLFDFGFASANLGAFNSSGTAFGSSTLTSAFASSSSATLPSATSAKKAKTEEVWKRVADVNLNFLPDGCDPDRYHVSDLGRCKSIINGRINYLNGSISDRDGYVQISFSVSRMTVQKLHRVICWAFNGAPPEGYQADHIDGNRMNNGADNLQWLSAEDNNGRARSATATPAPKTAKQQAFVFKQPAPQLLSSSVWLRYEEEGSVEVSNTGFVRKVGSNRLINVVCSESGHLQADWNSVVNGKRKHFKRYISKMVYITHHGAISKDGKGLDLKVDHLDENPHNNHMDNLRLLTHEENRRRSTNVNSNNSSGVTGVSYNITTGRWAAYIRVDNRLINLGNFESIEGAAAARDAAERKHKYGKYHDTASTNRDDTSNTEQ
eukprot:1770-Heterococcus_DN1.PRE.2